MHKTILIFIGIVIIILLLTKRSRDTIAGICKGAMEQTIRKNENKQNIVEFLKDKNEVSNHEIGQYLKVSPRTVVRYIDELELEGKVK